MGVIEPVGGGEGDLPPGFFARTVPHLDRQGKQVQTRFVCCTMRCVVYDREDYQERWVRDGRSERLVKSGKTIIAGAPATKMVPLLLYPDRVDPFSMMKAETGAVGRALGMAGMLVVPGAGVATAEDMNEAAQQEEVGGTAESPEASAQAPPPPATAEQAEDEDTKLREEATIAITELRTNFPEAYEEFTAWTRDRGIKNLGDQTGPTLKGLVKKAQKTLDQAKHAPEEPEEGPEAEPEGD